MGVEIVFQKCKEPVNKNNLYLQFQKYVFDKPQEKKGGSKKHTTFSCMKSTFYIP